MRVILAAVAGGIIMFAWSALAHMVLPIGEVGFRQAPNEEAIMAPMKANLREPGIYFIPGMDMQHATEAEQAAWAEKYKAGPRGLLVYQPTGADPMGAGMLLTELASNILACVCAAVILSWLALGFLGRVIASVLVGIAGWFSILVSMWNWYAFPTDYTAAQAVEQVVGWLLAGIVMAAIVRGKVSAGLQ